MGLPSPHFGKVPLPRLEAFHDLFKITQKPK